MRLSLAREFERLGHQPEFVVMQARGELLEEAAGEFPLVDLKCGRVREAPVALARYLRGRRPDGLLAAMWPLTVVAPVARTISARPCRLVVSEHNRLSVQYAPRGRLHRGALRLTTAFGYRMADGRIAVSGGVADDMAELSGLPRDRFAVIHNPLPERAANLQPDHDVEQLWCAPRGARILTVGHFKHQKNHALLLRSFAEIARHDARLMLLGVGELEPALRDLANALGISERVIFAGFRPDPAPFYRSADLFVLSSDYEGFGNVIVEALAHGTPVVSTDCPSGPRDILADGTFGALVPVGDRQALAREIDRSLSCAHDHARLRARARDFAPATAAKAYLDLLFPKA
ncbi:glycosyltransferase [Altererythrobacter sp. B11]|uniref:glycosyltransferase n=1 Tax=Altererythrobacter sp. B11 TaxID=2060312 RepID=UPI0018D52F14|nr:glycosyltransferase [Altererythrobacter sp. B11]